MKYEDTKKYRIVGGIVNFMDRLIIVPFCFILIFGFAVLIISMCIDNYALFCVMLKVSFSCLAIFVFLMIAYKCLKLIRKIMLENIAAKYPEKYFHITPYKAKILSITPDINVLNDISKSDNIERAKKVKVEDIIVQETYLENTYRELITGKIYESLSGKALTIEVSYDKANSSELEEYIKSHTKEKYIDNMTFSQYLDYLRQKAEEYYQNSADKNNLSEDGKVEKILEDYFNGKI